MGMSSSQARLLTLTARMHDIEYRAQRLEAQKLQMANESRRAYEDYLNELDRTKLEAKVLGQDGSMTSIAFTADAVYTYKQLTSQYALKTSDDKALIPESYHNAYQSTDNLSDYLKTFGVVADTISYNRYSEDINPIWQAEYDIWKADHDRWLEEKAVHDDWENRVNEYSEDHYMVKDLNTVDFQKATEYCRNRTLDYNDINCYQHVFAYIISFCNPSNEDSLYTDETFENFYTSGTTSYSISNIDINKFNQTGNYRDWTSTTNYYTSNGDAFNIVLKNMYQSGIYNGSDGSTAYEVRMRNALIEMSNKMHEKDASGNYKYNVPTFLIGENGEKIEETFDLLDKINAINNDSSLSDQEKIDQIKIEKLKSFWKEDGSTKSMLQWAKDLFYLVNQNVSTGPDTLNMVKTFINKLDSFMVFDEDSWLEDEPYLRPEPLFNPTAEKHLIEDAEVTTFNDKDYAQWLINIWYKMEGEDEVPEISEKTYTDVVTGEEFKAMTVDNKAKSDTTYETNKYDCLENENYIVIPQDKVSDPEWLKNCILEGWVLIQQFDKKGSKFNDTSVAVDTHLQEVSDERALKKAEAKYEADMRRIDQKDRRYDTQLAALDTERNAIKQEMETVKTVARDNVDRTFKLFS